MWLKLKHKSGLKIWYFDEAELLKFRSGFMTFLYLWRVEVVKMRQEEFAKMEASFAKNRNYPLSKYSRKKDSFQEFEYFENWMSYYFLREKDYSRDEIVSLCDIYHIMLNYSYEMYSMYEKYPVEKLVNGLYEEPAKESLFVFIQALYGLCNAAFVAKELKTGIEVEVK